MYSDDPAWRDLMWYHLLMDKTGDHYEAVLGGKIPDAFMIEVGDIARGHPGLRLQPAAETDRRPGDRTPLQRLASTSLGAGIDREYDGVSRQMDVRLGR